MPEPEDEPLLGGAASLRRHDSEPDMMLRLSHDAQPANMLQRLSEDCRIRRWGAGVQACRCREGAGVGAPAELPACFAPRQPPPSRITPCMAPASPLLNANWRPLRRRPPTLASPAAPAINPPTN